MAWNMQHLTVLQMNQMQSLVMRCHHSWSITARGEEKYDNPQVDQAAKDIICTHEEKTLLIGHLERMKNSHVPEKLLVYAPEHGK